MRADGFKDLEEKFETISNQIIDSLAEIPCKRLLIFMSATMHVFLGYVDISITLVIGAI